MPRNQYEDLEHATVLDENGGDDETVLVVKRRKRQTAKEPEGKGRLGRLPGLFVRVPLSWITGSPRACPFGERDRLFLYLLLRSRFGQRGVKLTSAWAAEVNVSPWARKRHLRWLEAEGWVRVERKGRAAPVVWPIVTAG
jgi:hypothetical protein